MTLRSRAVLIILGLAAFLVFAPAIVLLARGYYFDFHTGSLVRTGALHLKTDPKDAAVTLGGVKLSNTTPLTQRFVIPGDYLLQIEKQNFQAWKKEITIRPELVTYVPPSGPDSVVLFLTNPSAVNLSTSTADFFAENSSVYYAQQGKILSVQGNFLNPQSVLATSTIPSDARVTDTGSDLTGQNMFLISSSLGISKLTTRQNFALPADTVAAMFWKERSTTVLLNQKKQLLEIDSNSKQQTLRENISAFTIAVNLYALSAPSEGAPAQLLQISTDGQTHVLLPSLPGFGSAQILVTPSKLVFLLLDNTLYQAGDGLQKINSGVDRMNWTADFPGLIYGNSHEVWIYATDRQDNELVTRSSKMLSGPVYNQKTGYFFVAEDSQLKAIEYDLQGQENTYVLASTATANPKFTVNPDGNMILYLDENRLVSLKIR